ncbi:MAG: hypothetical protein HN704_17145 [Bacteroidetes bacterium]|jgi:hypothetical protein|nr:hypothetical protein [Bacteroidota bacterium]MBT6687418.1 hypothetical protein [Bacteroidota bacterium]MBT7144898.1 hypothetical protein [Bacteroidota bacterium]MBT7493328.1 hypothetical protein [Bacteroidota bacterium]
MQKSLKSIITKLIVFSAILITLSVIFYTTILKNFYLPVFPFLLALFILITAIIQIMLVRIGKNEMAKFTRYFMLTLTIKIFVFLIFLVSYIFLDKENAAIFLVTFLVLFIVFLLYEVITLYTAFQKN